MYKLVSIVLLALAYTAQASQACRLVRPENFNDLQKAEVVIKGRMLSAPKLANVRPYHVPYYRSSILVNQTLTGEPQLDGKNVEFVFYRSVNRSLRGVDKNTEVIVGLRKAREKEFDLSVQWFSVAGPCDSMGVILPTKKNLEGVMLGIKGQYLSPDLKAR